jgi:PAS domain S-box-containing protein
MSGLTNGGRAQAYDALRQSDELHRAVLGNVSDAVFVTDDDGHFTFICPNVDVIFGYAPDEVRAMNRISHLLGEDLYDLARLNRESELRNIEREITSKTGARGTVLIHVKRVAIDGGTVLCVCRDVTERRLAEENARALRDELEHASRHAVAGQMAASIMHEVTQPLASISMNATAGLRVMDSEAARQNKDTMLRDILADIKASSKLANEVIARLRALVSKDALQLGVLDANDVVRDLLELMTSDARQRGITLRAQLEGVGLHVLADRICLRQVLSNLIANAIDAASMGEHEHVVTVTSGHARDIVEIDVSDTGPGITTEAVDRLFEAFFTTKPRGMGLGLTIARSLMEAQGGALSLVEHGPGGARFRATLPAQLH